MTFKPAVWFPIAVALSVINVVAVGFAAREAEPWHAGIHAALGVAFAFWAQRLYRRPAAPDVSARLEALDADVNRLREQLSETQERLDFAERLLAQGTEKRRVEPPR